MGFTLLKFLLEDLTKKHEREAQNHEARNKVAQVDPWRDTLGVRGFGSARPEKRLGFTLSKLPLEDLQNRGPAEGGREEETSPRTEGSNTPTKVDGLSVYPFFLGLTWGHFDPRPSFGKGSGTCILRTEYPSRTCHEDSGWPSLPGAPKGISALFDAAAFHVKAPGALMCEKMS